ncbi:hypothetical protein K0M31_001159 [Melipona bicolor]|uniref:Uncharacterized protein n=1 Tax=Melipona bicolor TaxID=60889 RepID=A0AA40GEZ7_9HYME|nr:hypothetical protein K0M31_001159 [Melipona bicolor]
MEKSSDQRMLLRILAKPEEFAELAYELVIGLWLTVTRVLFSMAVITCLPYCMHPQIRGPP